MRARGVGGLAGALLLAACAKAPQPVQPIERPPPAPPPAIEQPESPEAELDRFCGALARIVDAEPERYASLRGSPDGSDRWAGETVPPRFGSCAVEGGLYPTSTYVCLGETLSTTSGGLLLPSFEQVGRMVDACLGRSSWYPREWRRGRVLALGGSGERQVVWRDVSVPEAPGIALKIEADISGRVFYLRLAVETLRLTQRPLVM